MSVPCTYLSEIQLCLGYGHVGRCDSPTKPGFPPGILDSAPRRTREPHRRRTVRTAGTYQPYSAFDARVISRCGPSAVPRTIAAAECDWRHDEPGFPGYIFGSKDGRAGLARLMQLLSPQ